jgi:signal transduction histidine kinase
MQKSLFKKYLVITMAIVFASYIVLGSVMMIFFYNYWRDEKQSLLTKNASSIASFVTQYTEYNSSTGKYEMDGLPLNSMFELLARNINADIFITDNEGNRIFGVYADSGLTSVDTKVDSEYVEKAQSGYYAFRSNFNGVYAKPYYAVAIPCYSTDTNGNRVVTGIVFATTSTYSVMAYMGDVFKIFLISALVTFLVTFVVVWGFTYRMVQPLRQMSQAARAFGNGDYTARVKVQSHDEIGELGVAFNNMADSISNVEGMRRSFIANVSHELKTPMTTIAGFIDGILDGTIPAEKEQHYLKIVSDEIKRLSRLVQSMLALSRIDSGELKIHPVRFDMTDTVCTTLLTFEKMIDDKSIQIKGLEETAPLMITGDEDLIHQVVYNLIENAVKFTNQGGYIKFVLTDSVDRVTVSIENSGMGIASDEISRVFEKFYKTDKSRSRDKNGLGLGLYLVKTIIQLHGGDITVSSVENQYCRFEFYIPKSKADQMLQLKKEIIPLTEKAEYENDIQNVD